MQLDDFHLCLQVSKPGRTVTVKNCRKQFWSLAELFTYRKSSSTSAVVSFALTESQNGRGWKGPLWVTQPNPLPKQGHPQQAAQDLVQAGLEYLQRRRLHNLPGQPVPGLRHPQREEVLPPVQLELPLLQFVPVAPCPVTGHHWKEPGPVLLTPTLQIFVSINTLGPTSSFSLTAT